jgi:hypothetical protein
MAGEPAAAPDHNWQPVKKSAKLRSVLASPSWLLHCQIERDMNGKSAQADLSFI